MDRILPRLIILSFFLFNLEKETMPFVHAFIETSDAFFDDILYDLRNPDQNFGTRWKRFSKLNDYLRGFRRGELTGK